MSAELSIGPLASLASSDDTRELLHNEFRDVYMLPIDWGALNHYAYAFVSPNVPDPGSIAHRALLLDDVP